MARSPGNSIATITAVGLGLLAAFVMVVGHHPWDGREITSFGGSHGMHIGDLLSVIPLAIGAALARWCWTRPS